MSLQSKWFDDLRAPARPVEAPPLVPDKPKRRTIDYTKRRQGGPGLGTPAQDEVAAFIKRRLESGEGSPTVEDIRAHMEWKKRASAVDCLRRLAARGALPASFDKSELMFRR